MPGLTQSKPLHKMGIRSSPTGQLFFDEVNIEPDRLLAGAGKDSARANFTTERFGVAAMALGIIEECLRLCIGYARNRTLWGKSIGDFQAATDVAMEAVQLFGGNGYMSEYRVEQLARDAKSLMIYAGSKRGPGHPHRQGPAGLTPANCEPLNTGRNKPVRGLVRTSVTE